MDTAQNNRSFKHKSRQSKPTIAHYGKKTKRALKVDSFSTITRHDWELYHVTHFRRISTRMMTETGISISISSQAMAYNTVVQQIVMSMVLYLEKSVSFLRY